jgi:hypothetical protein
VTIAQTGVVDFLGIEETTGHVMLALLDDLDWSDEQQHLVLLQEKLNTYLAFLESGEVYERGLENLGRRIESPAVFKISIIAKFDLTPRSKAFLAHAVEAFRNAGFSLGHQVVKASESPNDSQ